MGAKEEPVKCLSMLALALFLFGARSLAGDDLEEEYDRLAKRGAARDRFPVLHNPKLVPAAKAKGLRADQPVIGVAIGKEAKAYPISVMGVHELANDTCGGEAITVSW
jgi:hypothetical protein